MCRFNKAGCQVGARALGMEAESFGKGGVSGLDPGGTGQLCSLGP